VFVDNTSISSFHSNEDHSVGLLGYIRV